MEKQTMKICESAHNEIINFIASKPAESGGALFGREDDYVIQKFVPDVYAKTSNSTYTINTDYLNPIIKKLWKEEGLSLLGIVHSHPHGYKTLSEPDKTYFKGLLGMINRDRFFAPIVFTIPDGGFKLHPHVLDKNGEFQYTAILELVADSYRSSQTIIPIKRRRKKRKGKKVHTLIIKTGKQASLNRAVLAKPEILTPISKWKRRIDLVMQIQLLIALTFILSWSLVLLIRITPNIEETLTQILCI